MKFIAVNTIIDTEDGFVCKDISYINFDYVIHIEPSSSRTIITLENEKRFVLREKIDQVMQMLNND